MTYTFEVYDVLQCQRQGKWMDFATLRTEPEAAQAVRMVNTSRFEDETLPFRIVRSANRAVKYAR